MVTVAKDSGVIPSAQSKIEMGDTKWPNFDHVCRLARYYGFSIEDLFDATVTDFNIQTGDKRQPKQMVTQVPLLTWEEAGGKGISRSDFKTLASPFPCTNHAFALEVAGRSMVSNNSDYPSFSEGTIIIVEPHREAKHLDFVITVAKGAEKAAFKQLVLEDGQFLMPLNTQFPAIPFDNTTQVKGVVLGSINMIRS